MESEEITAKLADVIVGALQENRDLTSQENENCIRLLDQALVLQ